MTEQEKIIKKRKEMLLSFFLWFRENGGNHMDKSIEKMIDVYDKENEIKISKVRTDNNCNERWNLDEFNGDSAVKFAEWISENFWIQSSNDLWYFKTDGNRIEGISTIELFEKFSLQQ